MKLQQMQATLKQISQENNYGLKTQLLNAYPLLQRGIEIEHQSQMEIDGLKTYLAGQGMAVPASVLKNAIFLPKDLDDAHRRYPKIID